MARIFASDSSSIRGFEGIKCLGKIDIIAVRILKPLDLVPGPVELSPAIPLDFSEVRGGIDPLSLFIDGGQQFDRFKIPEGLFLPDGVGIKYGQRTGIVHLFLKKGNIVCDGLPALAVVKAIELFETGGGDLLGAFAES